ncbi:hypothetical protein Nizo1840_0095 [Lactiplantibacillus plantarum]|nr:hypothetical protein Nizo1840_0095 [Lactiplantibacillus plantarum]
MLQALECFGPQRLNRRKGHLTIEAHEQKCYTDQQAPKEYHPL